MAVVYMLSLTLFGRRYSTEQIFEESEWPTEMKTKELLYS